MPSVTPNFVSRDAWRPFALALVVGGFFGLVDNCRLLAQSLEAPAKPAVGAAPEVSEPGMPDDADHEALRRVREQLIAAVEAKDGAALLALLHPNVVLTAQDGAELRAVRGHDGVRDYLDRLLLGPRRGVESLKVNLAVDDLSILYHGNTAVAVGSSQDHYRLVDRSEFDLQTRWSATLVKEGDTWLVASLHVSSNLFNNPVLAALSKVMLWTAAGAALIGFVVGVAVRGLFRRPAK